MPTISVLHVFKDCGQTLLHPILEFSILIFTDCDRTEARTAWLEHLGVIQWRLFMTVFAPIVKLDVLTL